MSEENIEIVRSLYRAMNGGDLAPVADSAAPNMEWIPDQRVGEGPIRGRENVLRFFTEQIDMLADLRVEPERFWETGNKVLVFVHTTGRGRASGAPFDIRIANLWTLDEGGVVVRGEGFADRSDALKAAGLSVELE